MAHEEKGNAAYAAAVDLGGAGVELFQVVHPADH